MARYSSCQALLIRQQATASGKHINALLATEDTENIEPSSITPGTGGALRLEALTFRYPEKRNLCLISSRSPFRQNCSRGGRT